MVCDGTPAYLTTTVSCWPFVSGRAGVITSSWSPARANPATHPFTRTDSTSRAKSRLNRDRSFVAVARIVVVPLSRSVAGS